jgi:hypothetical protein
MTPLKKIQMILWINLTIMSFLFADIFKSRQFRSHNIICTSVYSLADHKSMTLIMFEPFRGHKTNRDVKILLIFKFSVWILTANYRT